MGSEIERDRAISTAAGRTRAKIWAEQILEREEGRAGSRMLAYGNLGRRIGRSGSWVRRLISGHAVGLAHETFERMRDAYVRHCGLVKAEGDAAAARAARMKAEADALEALIGGRTDGAGR